MSQLRSLVAGCSLRRPGFNTRSHHVIFVIDGVIQFYFPVISTMCSISYVQQFLYCHAAMCYRTVAEQRQMGNRRHGDPISFIHFFEKKNESKLAVDKLKMRCYLYVGTSQLPKCIIFDDSGTEIFLTPVFMLVTILVRDRVEEIPLENRNWYLE